MIAHECGIFAIYGHTDAARLTYFGLYAQQHRGQESAGIVSKGDNGIHELRNMGLVHEVFTDANLQNFMGDQIAIGHVRYSTSGKSCIQNSQPLLANYKGMNIAIAYNGTLTNTDELRDELEDEGIIFISGNDSEIFLNLFVHALRDNDPVEATRKACARIKGAYCFFILCDDTLIVVRDPQGFHPLSIGRLGQVPVFASETCAFDLIEAEYERSILPGEIYVVDQNAERSEKLVLDNKQNKITQCIFELVYFARPDSYIFDEQVYMCRKAMGKHLASESPVDVDFILPFPDSGVYPALGFAQEAKLPYEHAMIRNHYVGRTFIQPSQNMRELGARMKINPIKKMVEGKRICIVDDSIVRGTTMIARVRELHKLGAKEVHVRISSPPVKFPCFYGIDFASRTQLIAANKSIAEMIDIFKVDSLSYLSVESLLKSVSKPKDYCLACFTGEYPI